MFRPLTEAPFSALMAFCASSSVLIGWIVIIPREDLLANGAEPDSPMLVDSSQMSPRIFLLRPEQFRKRQPIPAVIGWRMSLRLTGLGALTLRPKQPMLDWLNSLAGSEPGIKLSKLRNHPIAVLVPQLESEAQVLQFLESNLNRFFEQALLAWSLDLNAWPRKRDLRSFRELFEVELCMNVFDLGPSERDQP